MSRLNLFLTAGEHIPEGPGNRKLRTDLGEAGLGNLGAGLQKPAPFPENNSERDHVR